MNRLHGVRPSICSLRLLSAVFLTSFGLILPTSYNSIKVSMISLAPKKLEPISSISEFNEPRLAINSLWRNCLIAGAVPESKLNNKAPVFSNSFFTNSSSSASSVCFLIARLAANLYKDSSANNGNVSSRKVSLKPAIKLSSMMLIEWPLPKPDTAKLIT